MELTRAEVGCGQNLPDLLAIYDPDTQSLKMSQTCLLALIKQGDGSIGSYQTWPSAGMMRNGKIYQLAPLVHPNLGRGYGLLPTPGARDYKDQSYKGVAYAASRGRHQPSLVTRSYLSGMGGQNLARIYEWVMGFTAGHTKLKPLETPLSPKSPK